MAAGGYQGGHRGIDQVRINPALRSSSPLEYIFRILRLAPSKKTYQSHEAFEAGQIKPQIIQESICKDTEYITDNEEDP